MEDTIKSMTGMTKLTESLVKGTECVVTTLDQGTGKMSIMTNTITIRRTSSKFELNWIYHEFHERKLIQSYCIYVLAFFQHLHFQTMTFGIL